ncbi:MAG: DNA adenine methylase [Eubacteriales bacterium]|nr:DNA adenine methylase [Eubacteriales bacterium]MDD3350198.1 DNA adenine methylase [Eubacteriales bacterium]
MPKTDSPLRYPGGKTKLYNLIQPVIESNLRGNARTYVEPFAGGAGLALKLLFNGDVDRIVLNDVDYRIYCFWHTCVHAAEELCAAINDCTIDIVGWHEQREIYGDPFSFSCSEVAFATFFLNRCNVSGIIGGGPIGGIEQTGTYKLDARFNTEDLIRKIRKIYDNRERIDVYNLDATVFLQTALPHYPVEETILNIDPPYVKKGPLLYENSFTEADHAALATVIGDLGYKWIVTYDECETIYNLYSPFRKEIIVLSYSVGHAKQGRELIIYSDTINLDIEQAAL